MGQHAILYRNDGAGDRGRTGTVSLPPDFESGTSANSITPANKMSCRPKSARHYLVEHRGVEPLTF